MDDHEEACPHGLGEPDWCAICLDHQVETAKPRKMPAHLFRKNVRTDSLASRLRAVPGHHPGIYTTSPSQPRQRVGKGRSA